MLTDKQRVRLLMGTTGSGKTTMMQRLLKQENRCMLFDTMNDKAFEKWGILCESMEDAVHLAGKSDQFHIRVQFADVERFDFWCSLLVKQPHGHEVFYDTCTAVDELAMFCSSQWMPPNFSNLIRLGRHTQARFVATTQRPPDIHPFIRSQAKEQYLFQMHEQADLDVFRKRLPNPERLIGLKVGEYILWNPATTKNYSETE